VNWLRDEQRPDGPPGRITFAISMRMTQKLKKHILRLPDSLWKPYREDGEAMSECADLMNYWPEEEDRPEGVGPLRYVAIRVRKRQGELFAEGSEFATSSWQRISGNGVRGSCWNGTARRPVRSKRCMTY